MASPSWMDELPRLSGAFLDVREVVADDAPTLYELLSDSAVTCHLSSPPPSVEAFGGFVRWARSQRAAGASVTFGIVPHGLHCAVGIMQVRALDPKWAVAEWGFALGSAFWGTGVFVEAASLVVAFAFDAVGADRLEARAVVSNGRANGALQKIGAAAEVVLTRSFKRGTDEYDEQLLWSVRAEEWRQRGLGDRGRFSADVVRQRIAGAVADVQQQLARQPSPTPSASEAPQYPFLLTRDLTRRQR